MREMMKTLLPAIALMLFLNGCQAITGETLGENIDDTTITTTVKATLARENGTTLTRIQVNTNRGVVQLSGVVETGDDRVRAEQVTRGVGGVKDVVNNIQVR